MKRSLIILTFLISVPAFAEPWDRFVNELTTKITLTEIKDAKGKFYSRFDRTPLTRSIDFGFEHTVWEFDIVHGNSSTDFKLSLITRNDNILFGQLERQHWRGKTAETVKFSVDSSELSDLVNNHNGYYSTSYSIDHFIKELTKDLYYSLGCGETGSILPKEAKHMLTWVKSRSVKKLSNWLSSPNFELQAYAIDGLLRIKENGKSLPEQQEQIIEHLRNRNSVVINCAGCLMGLETPVNELLFEYPN